MTSTIPELRKWRREGDDGVSGTVHGSDIWDEGERAFLFPGYLQDSGYFYLFVMGVQVYKLPKDEEIKDGGGDVGPPSG